MATLLVQTIWKNTITVLRLCAVLVLIMYQLILTDIAATETTYEEVLVLIMYQLILADIAVTETTYEEVTFVTFFSTMSKCLDHLDNFNNGW